MQWFLMKSVSVRFVFDIVLGGDGEWVEDGDVLTLVPEEYLGYVTSDRRQG